MLEWYEAYADYEDGMERVERGHRGREGARDARSSGRHEIDLTPPWPRMPLRDAIHEHAGIDPMADRDRDRLVAYHARGRDRHPADETWAEAVDHLLSHFVEPAIERADVPGRLPGRALAARQAHARTIPRLVERFEAFCVGMEIGNGYTELNDPDDQRAAVRGAGRGARPTTTTCWRSSTGCLRPSASGSASTGCSWCSRACARSAR